ncbi:hypothetical protein N800_05720 [Lysobacter daejeonensis GH1-9]|uniref:Ubiquinone biosynthesis protein UbiH n=1 Tax=Lysobacter daejeonensis GH1-9 TaxID=1385517 RepID=A0A0A0ESZ0_9GAMM|nr:OB-fold-containig protein [Lysobacter daejeonensis]KGM54071.1 hypothetical protein N800_05720 [Lysobacter daejeonensis GH1-9]
MTEFLTTVLTLPTLPYSVLLAVCTTYWLLAATGLLEIDALDGVLGTDGDASDASAVAAMLAKLGLSGVPVMLVLTVLAFIGWLGTYFVQLLVLNHLPDAFRVLVGLAIGVLMLVPGLVATSLLLRPVSRLLLRLRPPRESSLLGRVAVVSTPHVATDYGMAAVDDGAAGLVLQVRHDDPGKFRRGDRVVLIEYLGEQHAYRIISEQQFQSL